MIAQFSIGFMSSGYASTFFQWLENEFHLVLILYALFKSNRKIPIHSWKLPQERTLGESLCRHESTFRWIQEAKIVVHNGFGSPSSHFKILMSHSRHTSHLNFVAKEVDSARKLCDPTSQDPPSSHQAPSSSSCSQLPPPQNSGSWERPNWPCSNIDQCRKRSSQGYRINWFWERWRK